MLCALGWACSWKMQRSLEDESSSRTLQRAARSFICKGPLASISEDSPGSGSPESLWILGTRHCEAGPAGPGRPVRAARPPPRGPGKGRVLIVVRMSIIEQPFGIAGIFLDELIETQPRED